MTPVVHVDYRRMDALLDLLDQKAGQPARDAGISFHGGQIALTKPQNGVAIDHDHAREALIDAYAAGTSSVQLPLLLSQPDVDESDLDTALATIANPAMAGPVTLAFDGSQVTLEPRQYADLLSLVDQDGALALDVDSAGLAALVNPSAHDTQYVRVPRASGWNANATRFTATAAGAMRNGVNMRATSTNVSSWRMPCTIVSSRRVRSAASDTAQPARPVRPNAVAARQAATLTRRSNRAANAPSK